MSYYTTIGIILEPDQTGLTLVGRYINKNGQPVGDPVTTGFIEIGGGYYVLRTVLPADDVIGIKFYDANDPNTLLTFATIDVVERRRLEKLDLLVENKLIISAASPLSGRLLTLVRGDEYTTALDNPIKFIDDGSWPQLGVMDAVTLSVCCGTKITTTCSVSSGPPQTIVAQFTDTQTSQLSPGQGSWHVRVVKNNKSRVLLRGTTIVTATC